MFIYFFFDFIIIGKEMKDLGFCITKLGEKICLKLMKKVLRKNSIWFFKFTIHIKFSMCYFQCEL